MTKLEYIREKCIEANSEIMELKFGCYIKWKADLNDQEGYVSIVENWISRTDETLRCLMPLGNQGVVSLDHITEILGRPIRLADVLLALDEVSSQELVIHMDGELGVNDRAVKWKNTYWNLLDNDLTNQNEETIDFLALTLGYE